METIGYNQTAEENETPKQTPEQLKADDLAVEKPSPQEAVESQPKTPKDIDQDKAEIGNLEPIQGQIEPEKAEAPKENNKNKERLDQITELIQKTNQAAEEITRRLIRIKSAVNEISPRDPSFRALNQIYDDRINLLLSRTRNLDNQDDLRRAGTLLYSNDPRAQSYFEQAVDHLSHQWHFIGRELDEAYHAAEGYRRKTEEARKFDRDDTVSQVARHLRSACDIYEEKGRFINRF